MWDFKIFLKGVKGGNLKEVVDNFQIDFLEMTDVYKWQPIHWACRNGHLEIVKFLIQNKCSIECEDIWNRRPIHCACMKGSLEIVEFLIQCNCELDCRDEDGRTPIELAMKYGSERCANILKETLERKKLSNRVDGTASGQLSLDTDVAYKALRDIAKLVMKDNDQYEDYLVESRNTGQLKLTTAVQAALQKRAFQVQDLTDKIDSMRNNFNNSKIQLDAIENERKSLEKQFLDLRSKYDYNHRELDNMQRECERMRHRIATLEEDDLFTLDQSLLNSYDECKTYKQESIKAKSPELQRDKINMSDNYQDLNSNQERQICSICHEREVNCVFECGHTFCVPCGMDLFNCPICNAECTDPKYFTITYE